jgi:hypothetical protein
MSCRDITDYEYYKEIRAIVENTIDEVISEWLDEDYDIDDVELDIEKFGDVHSDIVERIWENVDGHQWVIYTAYNWDVLKISENNDYAITEFCIPAQEDYGLNTCALAFGAMYADCMEYFERYEIDFNTYRENEDETDE